MSENCENTNPEINNVPETDKAPGMMTRVKNAPWKKIGIYTAGTALVAVGGYFAYNGLMARVVEVATETAETVLSKSGEVAETISNAS